MTASPTLLVEIHMLICFEGRFRQRSAAIFGRSTWMPKWPVGTLLATYVGFLQWWYPKVDGENA